MKAGIIKNKKAEGATIATMIGFAVFIVIGAILAFSLAASAGIQLGGVCSLTGTCNRAAGADQLVANLHTKHMFVMIASLSTNPVQIWDKKDDSTTYDVLASGDLNGNGIDEIIASAKKGNSRVISVIYPGDTYSVADDVGSNIYPTMTAGDFDNDGRAEIAVVAHKHAAKAKGDTIIIYDEVTKNYGSRLITLKTYADKHFTAIAAGDFDADGKADLALGTDDGKILILTEVNLGKGKSEEAAEETAENAPVLPSKQGTPTQGSGTQNKNEEEKTVGAKEARTIAATGNFNPNLIVGGNFSGLPNDGIAYFTTNDYKLWIVQDVLRDTPRLVHDFGKKNKINGLAVGDFNGDLVDDTISLRDSDDMAFLITDMEEEKPEVTKAFHFGSDVKGIVGGEFALE